MGLVRPVVLALNLIGREGKFYCSFQFFLNNGMNNGSFSIEIRLKRAVVYIDLIILTIGWRIGLLGAYILILIILTIGWRIDSIGGRIY